MKEIHPSQTIEQRLHEDCADNWILKPSLMNSKVADTWMDEKFGFERGHPEITQVQKPPPPLHIVSRKLYTHHETCANRNIGIGLVDGLAE